MASGMKTGPPAKRATRGPGKMKQLFKQRPPVPVKAASPVGPSVKAADVKSTNTGSGRQPQPPLVAKHTVGTVLTEDGTEVPQRANTRVFVDGLPYHEPTGDGAVPLFDALSDFVKSWNVGVLIRLIKKPGNGFGYLCFRSPNSVDVAVRVLHDKKFQGRKLRVEVPKDRTAKLQELAQKNDDSVNYTRQVLISDLSKISTPELIREVIRDCAPDLETRIESIKMVSGGRKAFITAFAAADVELLVQSLNGFALLGRTIRAERAQAPGTLPFSKPAKVAVKRPRPAEPTTAQATTAAAAQPPAVIKPEVKYNYADQGESNILVGNVADETTVDDLKRHFATCGRIIEAELFVNEHTKQPCGIGRVKFAIPAHALYAKENLDGSVLNGEMIRIDRGDEQSHFGPNADAEEAKSEDSLDVVGFMKHHGIDDPKKYFDDSDEEKQLQQQKPLKKREHHSAAVKGAQNRPRKQTEDAARGGIGVRKKMRGKAPRK